MQISVLQASPCTWGWPLYGSTGQWAYQAVKESLDECGIACSWLICTNIAGRCSACQQQHLSPSTSCPVISLGFTILLLLLSSQLYLWGSPFFFLWCVSNYISGVHHSSSSALPAISFGFTTLLLLFLLHFQLYLWGSPFVIFFFIPSYISGVHYSSSSSFPAISLGFTILLVLLYSQL